MRDTSIEQRLDRLERAGRRLTLGAVCVAGVCLAGVLMGSDAPKDTITADYVVAKMVVADSFALITDGKLRGTFALGEDGNTPNLTLRDDKGNNRISLALHGDLAAIVIGDRNGMPRVNIAYENSGVAAVELRDAEGRTRSRMTASTNGASIGVLDANGTPRVLMASTPEGVLGVTDANGKRIAGLP